MAGVVQVVINIGVMVAGVDWPRIDCIVIARQTRNIASWIQMIGRGSRLFPDKSDCIVIYHGDNFDDLGRIDSDIEWSLDGDETLRARREKKKTDNKEPKELVCKECKSVFSGVRLCPVCGYELIKKGEKIPVHEAELKEVKTSSVDKVIQGVTVKAIVLHLLFSVNGLTSGLIRNGLFCQRLRVKRL
jgi:superfamily II DNA or RNA helicase